MTLRSYISTAIKHHVNIMTALRQAITATPGAHGSPDLYGCGESADAVTVADELNKRGELGRAGEPAYLHTLLSSVPTAPTTPGSTPASWTSEP